MDDDDFATFRALTEAASNGDREAAQFLPVFRDHLATLAHAAVLADVALECVLRAARG